MGFFKKQMIKKNTVFKFISIKIAFQQVKIMFLTNILAFTFVGHKIPTPNLIQHYLYLLNNLLFDV